MSPVLIVAATSKVPFFILGGGLAVWAGVLSWLGLTRPDFPSGAGSYRGVMLATFLLMLAAIGSAIVTA